MGIIYFWSMIVTVLMMTYSPFENGTCVGFAAELSVEPTMTVRGEYNDNLLLTTFPHDPVYGSWISPRIRGNYLQENFEARGNSHWDFVGFIDNPGLNIIQQFYDATALYRTETSEWSLHGIYTRDSVLQTELQQTGVAGELGAVGKRGIRKLASMQPTWTFMATEQIRVLGSYTYSDVSFDTPIGSGFSDFNNHAGVLTLTYRPFERTQLRGTGTYSNFHSPAANNRSITYGGELEISQAMTETFNISALGGLRLVSSKFPTLTPSLQLNTAKTDQLVTVFGGTLQKQFERLSLRAEGSRQIAASGIGRLNKTDRASFTVTHQFTEYWSVSLAGDLIQTKSLSRQNVQIPKATFISIKPSVSWHIMEDLYLSGSFSHRQVTRESSSGPNTTATSNAVIFSLTYEFPKFATSR